MEFSDTFKRKIRDLFRHRTSLNTTRYSFSAPTLGRYIKVNLLSPQLYCPLAIVNDVLAYSSPSSFYNQLNLLLGSVPEDQIEADYVSGGDAFLTKISTGYHAMGINQHLHKIITKTDNKIYYALPGLILDNNFNVLLEYGYKLTKSDPSTPNPLSEYFRIERPYFKVGYKVFEDPSATLSKYVINKIIPYILTYPNLNCSFRRDNQVNEVDIPVLMIERKIDLMETPAQPTMELLNPENVREFLLRSSESLAFSIRTRWV